MRRLRAELGHDTTRIPASVLAADWGRFSACGCQHLSRFPRSGEHRNESSLSLVEAGTLMKVKLFPVSLAPKVQPCDLPPFKNKEDVIFLQGGKSVAEGPHDFGGHRRNSWWVHSMTTDHRVPAGVICWEMCTSVLPGREDSKVTILETLRSLVSAHKLLFFLTCHCCLSDGYKWTSRGLDDSDPVDSLRRQ